VAVLEVQIFGVSPIATAGGTASDAVPVAAKITSATPSIGADRR
jgi:hypothetical protein